MRGWHLATTRVSEDSLKGRTIDYFISKGYTRHEEQVPFLSRFIDLCFYDPDSRRVASVELKVKNWRDALRQARVYQLCSDEVYVVMHPAFVHRANAELFEQFGVGLLAFGAVPEIRVGAMPSPVLKERLRDRLLPYLEPQDVPRHSLPVGSR